MKENYCLDDDGHMLDVEGGLWASCRGWHMAFRMWRNSINIVIKFLCKMRWIVGGCSAQNNKLRGSTGITSKLFCGVISFTTIRRSFPPFPFSMIFFGKLTYCVLFVTSPFVAIKVIFIISFFLQEISFPFLLPLTGNWTLNMKSIVFLTIQFQQNELNKCFSYMWSGYIVSSPLISSQSSYHSNLFKCNWEHGGDECNAQ